MKVFNIPGYESCFFLVNDKKITFVYHGVNEKEQEILPHEQLRLFSMAIHLGKQLGWESYENNNALEINIKPDIKAKVALGEFSFSVLSCIFPSYFLLYKVLPLPNFEDLVLEERSPEGID